MINSTITVCFSSSACFNGSFKMWFPPCLSTLDYIIGKELPYILWKPRSGRVMELQQQQRWIEEDSFSPPGDATERLPLAIKTRITNFVWQDILHSQEQVMENLWASIPPRVRVYLNNPPVTWCWKGQTDKSPLDRRVSTWRQQSRQSCQSVFFKQAKPDFITKLSDVQVETDFGSFVRHPSVIVRSVCVHAQVSTAGESPVICFVCIHLGQEWAAVASTWRDKHTSKEQDLFSQSWTFLESDCTRKIHSLF